jgi:hypothetical protein
MSARKLGTDSEKYLGQYCQIQLFITGLQDQIQKELMKSTYANFWATYEATLDLEVIQEDDKPVKPVTVAAFLTITCPT